MNASDIEIPACLEKKRVLSQPQVTLTGFQRVGEGTGGPRRKQVWA